MLGEDKYIVGCVGMVCIVPATRITQEVEEIEHPRASPKGRQGRFPKKARSFIT